MFLSLKGLIKRKKKKQTHLHNINKLYRIYQNFLRRRYSLYRVITWPWSSILWCKHTWRKNGVKQCFSSLEGQSDLTSRKLWKLAENSLIFLLFCQKNENFSPKVPIMTFWCGRKKWRGRRTVNISFDCGGLKSNTICFSKHQIYCNIGEKDETDHALVPRDNYDF